MKKVYTHYGLWLQKEADNRVRIGLSLWGQDAAGEISFFDLQEEQVLVKDHPFFSIEGSKAVTEMEAPFDAKVLEINERLRSYPSDLNEVDDAKNWIMLVSGEHFNPDEFLAEDRPID